MDYFESALRKDLSQVLADGQGRPNEQHIDTVVEWARVARRRRPVVLVGAGMSCNAEPREGWRSRSPELAEQPRAQTWDWLATRWRGALEPSGEGKEADVLWLAELFQQRFSRQALIATLREAVPEEQLQYGAAHEALVAVPWEAAITTNYDRLVEKALDGGQKTYRVAANDIDLTHVGDRPGGLTVLHAHGVLDRDDTLIVTLEDFRRFPSERPATLTKIRQLLLEHPLALVGFSGQDPNFVQWEGWLRDLVGPLQLPGLCLVRRGAVPSLPRQSYWGNRLSFVEVEPDRLGGFFQSLAAFLAADREQIAKGIPAAMAATENAAAAVQEMQRALDVLRRLGRLAERDEAHRKVVDACLRRAFELAHPEDSEEPWRAAFCRPDVAAWREAPSEGRHAEWDRMAPRRDAIRAAFGPAWWPFLAVLGKTYGPFLDLPFSSEAFNECEPVEIDLARILAESAAEIPEPEARAMRTAVLVRRIETARDDDEIDALLRDERSARGGEDLSPAELEDLQDARTRRRLLIGERLDERDDEPAETAQAARRRGYLCWLNGDMERAAAHYEEAARRSRREDEAPDVERLTLETAQGARSIGGHLGDSREFADSLSQRLHELERLPCPAYADFEWAERAAERAGIEDLLALSDRRPEDVSGGFRRFGGAESLRARCEDLWVKPQLAAHAAELHALTLLRSGNAVSALRTAAAYGSKQIALLTRRIVASSAGGALPEAVFDEVLRAGRWPSEWRAKLRALAALVIELPAARVAAMRGWLADCAQATLGGRVHFSGPRGVSVLGQGDAGDLAAVIDGYWMLLDDEAVLDDWQTWSGLNLPTHRVAHLRSSIAGGLLRREWPAERVQRLGRERVDKCVADAARSLATSRPFWGREQHVLAQIVRHAEYGRLDLDRLPELKQALRPLAEAARGEAAGRSVLDFELLACPPEVRAALRERRRREALEALQDHNGRTLRTDALHELAVLVPDLGDDEAAEVLAFAKKQLQRAEAEPDRFDTEIHTAPDAAADLAAALIAIERDADGEWSQLLARSVRLDPWALQHVAHLPPNHRPFGRETFEILVSRCLHGVASARPMPRSLVVLAGIHAVEMWADGPAGELPTAWLAGLIAAASNDDAAIRRDALDALGRLLRDGRISLDTRDMQTLLLHTLQGALLDGRAYSASAAAYALVEFQHRLPEDAAVRADAEAAISRLRTDPRALVQVKLQRAEARVAERRPAPAAPPAQPV